MKDLTKMLLVAELKMKGEIDIKLGVTMKMKAKIMHDMFTKRKDKNLSEKDFYNEAFLAQMEQFVKDETGNIFIDIYYEEGELED